MTLDTLAHEILLVRDDLTNAIRGALRLAEKFAGTPKCQTWQQYAAHLEWLRQQIDTQGPEELHRAMRVADGIDEPADEELASVQADC